MAHDTKINAVGRGALGVALLVAPLAIGSVHLPVVFGLLVLAACAAGAGLHMRKQRVVLSPLFLMLLGVVVVALGQLVPLPDALLSWLSPAGVEHAEAARRLISPDQSWAWRPVTMDPDATLDRVVRAAALALMLFAASNLFGASTMRRDMSRVVMASGGLMLILGAGQKLLDPKLILGFYEAQVPADLGSTFVNWNHAASLYVLCFLLALFAARDRKRARPERVGAAALGVVFFGAVWLNQSLSAAALAICGAVVFAADTLARQRGLGLAPSRDRTRWAWLCAAGFLTGTGVVWWWANQLVVGAREVLPSVRGRIALARGALDASASFVRAGAGAGALERVIYPHVDWSLTQEATIVVVENDILGWLLELGWLAAGALTLALLVAALGPLVSGAAGARWKRAHTEGCMLAVFSLSVIQLHFPLYALGLGAPLLVSWELWRRHAMRLRERTESSSEGRIERGVVRLSTLDGSRRVALALLAALTLAGGVSFATLQVRRPGTGADLTALTHQQVEALAPRIPSEGRLFVRLAQDALARGDGERAVALMRHAWELQPMPRVRVILASVLAAQGEGDEARAHYQALLFGEHRARRARFIAFVLEGLSAPDARARVFAPGDEELWQRAGLLIREREGDGALLAFADALLDERPGQITSYRFVLWAHEVTGRAELLVFWARHLLRARVDDPAAAREEAVWHLARAQARRGDRVGARALIDEAITSLPERHHARLELLSLQLSSGADILALAPEREALEVLAARHQRVCLAAPDLEPRERRHCDTVRAYIHEARGEHEEAERYFRLLSSRGGGRDDPLAGYYLRNGRCLQLKLLASRAPEASRARLNAMVERCYASE